MGGDWPRKAVKEVVLATKYASQYVTNIDIETNAVCHIVVPNKCVAALCIPMSGTSGPTTDGITFQCTDRDLKVTVHAPPGTFGRATTESKDQSADIITCPGVAHGEDVLVHFYGDSAMLGRYLSAYRALEKHHDALVRVLGHAVPDPGVSDPGPASLHAIVLDGSGVTLREWVDQASRAFLAPMNYQFMVFFLLTRVGDTLCCMHEMNLIHGCVNPDDIRVTGSAVRVSGLHCCTSIGDDAVAPPSNLTFAAPEVLRSLAGPPTRAHPSQDVWSLGMVLTMMLPMALPPENAWVRDVARLKEEPDLKSISDPRVKEVFLWETMRPPDDRLFNFVEQLCVIEHDDRLDMHKFVDYIDWGSEGKVGVAEIAERALEARRACCLK